MREIVVLLTKSPLPRKGRFGRESWQDWYRGCRVAVALALEHDASILVASAFKTKDGTREAEFYREVLERMGVAKVVVVEEGLETIGQLDAAFKAAAGRDLVVVSSAFHFPRVWWLCRGKSVRHHVVWGIPRPSEAIVDILLAILFPLIDFFGWRDKLQKRSEDRRVAGKI